MTSFPLEEGDFEGGRSLNVQGNGVTQLNWSGDGRYLFVAERNSQVLQVYDIRIMGKRLSWCRGRNAGTMMPLSFDTVDLPGQGVDIWAGGVDGKVRVWKDVTAREGEMYPDSDFQASTGESTLSICVADMSLTMYQKP